MTSRLFDLTGRTALVTGSSRGIGFGLARGLADAGATVVLNGRDRERLDAAHAELAAGGGTFHAVPFDVTDSAAVAAAIDDIEARIGAIDVLVNNAGMQFRTPLEDFPDDKWRAIMAANVDSVFVVGRAVARHMIGRKRGAIVNICSLMSEVARPTIAPYTASKGAVKMLTKGMAVDWGKHGIRVNGIGPGYFATELNKALVEDEKFDAWLRARTPMGRWGAVEELVGAAVFLSSDASSFVTGQVVYVDGGILSSV